MKQVPKVKRNVTLDRACDEWVTREVTARRKAGRNSNRSQVVNEAVFKMAEKVK